MNALRRRPIPEPHQSDFGSSVQIGTDGEVRYAIPIVVEDVAVGTRSTVRRARRADPLGRVEAATLGMRLAASIYRQAAEHVQAGRGMGPMPWSADKIQDARGGSAGLLPQERAVSAALWYRRGVQAMGMAASEGVVHWVVIAGLPLDEYDATRGWRKGGACEQLIVALTRLSKEYGCE